MMDYSAIMSSIPEGKKEDWEVKRFTINKEEAERFNVGLLFSRQGGREVEPGTYTKLTHKGQTIMSDTPAEKGDCRQVVYYAMGNMLINGLGLGWVIEACMQKKEVSHITTIEIEPNVVELVGSYLLKKYPNRLSIILADSLLWKSPKNEKYDIVWHDIWPEICGDNYRAMKILRRKYAQKSFWQGAWCADWVKELSKQGSYW